MKIKEGEKLRIKCGRKGRYDAIAQKDFDTETSEWYPVIVDQDEPVRGMVESWYRGDSISCRRGQAEVEYRDVFNNGDR